MCFRHQLAMITECWTPQSNHRDTFFSIYLVCECIIYLGLKYRVNIKKNDFDLLSNQSINRIFNHC